MISISVDEGDSQRPEVIKWDKEMKSGFRIVQDPVGASVKPFQLDEGIPYNVVLDRNGKVVGATGPDPEEIAKLAAKAVEGAPPAAHRRARR